MGWITRFALRAMIPRTEGVKGVGDTGLKPFLKRLNREGTFMFKLGLRASTWVFILTPLFTVFIPAPAFLLSARLRDKHARKLAAHSVYLLRQSAFMLKMVAALCWAADSEVRARVGLTPLTPDPGTWREGE